VVSTQSTTRYGVHIFFFFFFFESKEHDIAESKYLANCTKERIKVLSKIARRDQ
jgi:hypothetical protein